MGLDRWFIKRVSLKGKLGGREQNHSSVASSPNLSILGDVLRSIDALERDILWIIVDPRYLAVEEDIHVASLLLLLLRRSR